MSRTSRRAGVLLLIAVAGILVGSCISVGVSCLHYPDEAMSFVPGWVTAVISSPLSMTFGVFPSLGFYGAHGWLVIPGMLCTFAGSVAYFRVESIASLACVFLGFVLWSHNNLLASQALMSV